MNSAIKARPVLENTPQRQWESFHCEVVRGRSYGAQWHFHPEHQLTLVLKSHGHRVVGDNITPLSPGDLVLVGGNVPHVWHVDGNAHDFRHWKGALYQFAQLIFKPTTA